MEDSQIEKICLEYAKELSKLTSINDCKDLLFKIKNEGLEENLFPYVRAMETIITGNKDLVEILSPEYRIVVDKILERIPFEFELTSKGIKR